VFTQLLEQAVVKRPRQGRSRRRPKRIVGDKVYSSHTIRRMCRRRGIRYTIPRKDNEHRTGPFDRQIYRQRNIVERSFAWFARFHRLARDYERLPGALAGLHFLAAVLLMLESVVTLVAQYAQQALTIHRVALEGVQGRAAMAIGEC